jgi:GT2 family glycosyltransferase
MNQAYRDFEVILVDNGSSDDSVNFIQEAYPQIRLLQNSQNLGFAGPNNQAIRVAQGRYIITLNNDTEVPPDWLQVLLLAAETHPDMGAFASLVVFDDRRHMIDSAGLSVSLAGIGCQNRMGGDVEEVQEPEEVFGVCAAAALYRRELLDDVGLFDEDYFAYYEDVDLAWRARLRGWRALLVPQAVVYHVHSATGGRASPFKEKLITRNKVWTTLKNYPFPAWLFFLPLILAYDIITACAPLLRGDPYPLLGLWQGIRQARIALAKRPAIQSGRAASFREMMPFMRCFSQPFGGWLAQRKTGRL